MDYGHTLFDSQAAVHKLQAANITANTFKVNEIVERCTQLPPNEEPNLEYPFTLDLRHRGY